MDAQFHCFWLSLLRVMLFSCLGGHPSSDPCPFGFESTSYSQDSGDSLHGITHLKLSSAYDSDAFDAVVNAHSIDP